MKMKRGLILSAIFGLVIFTFGAEKKVSLATLDWAPYIDQNIQGKGYVYEVVVEAFKRSGYKADIKFYPWARAVNLVESGDVDVLFPEYYDESRKKTCVFSESFPGGPVGLFKRKSLKVSYSADPLKEQTKALKALSKYSFGVVRGYVNTKAFDDATFLKKEVAVSDEINLKKLNGERIDFIFIDKFVALYLLNKKFPQFKDKLEFMEPPLEKKDLYLAFSKKTADHMKKLKAYNAGLKQIKVDGTLAKIMKKYGF